MTSLTHSLRLRGASSPAPEAETPEPPQAARTETNPVIAAQPAAPAAEAVSTRDWLRGVRHKARDTSQREGHWVRDGLAGRPPSVDGQRAYLANRGWLQPGHEGGIADRIGEAYIVAVGIPGVAAGNTWAWLCARQFRFAWALVAWPLVSATVSLLVLHRASATFHVVAAMALTPLHWAHIPTHGVGALAIDPDIAVIAWIAVVAGALALRRAWHRSRNPQEN